MEGRNRGNSRNGKRSKTVLTDAAGAVEIEVPRDREGTFAPVIARLAAAPVVGHRHGRAEPVQPRGKLDAEVASGARVSPGLPVVELGNFPDDGKPETAAAFIAVSCLIEPYESLEYSIAVSGPDALAIIVDEDSGHSTLDFQSHVDRGSCVAHGVVDEIRDAAS